MKKATSEWFRDLQLLICNGIEHIDHASKFVEDAWIRPGGGGGFTRVFLEGKIIEKGGVNFSAVFGEAPDFLKKQLYGNTDPANFFATGISIVLHPKNPNVPIIHMNLRYFESGKISWFGGGIDLTPHYINNEDAVFFHKRLKDVCDKYDRSYYHDFKNEADDYFFIKHRNETRGIGGIFFDHLKPIEKISMENRFEFVKGIGELFFPLYKELIIRNNDKSFTENEIRWQQLRRGRYVEFNLVYDRGTKFGLETDGRTESILMSLPPLAKWEYDYKAEAGSKEEQTLSLLCKGIDWAGK